MSDSTEKKQQTGFMQRWSQRKHESRQEVVNEKPPEETVEKVTTPEPQAEKLKTDADMPPLESLTEESDFSGFLSPQVSEALRKQALRKLFHMPSMNVVDELDDYAEDYTSFTSLGDIIPHDLKRMLEREQARAQQAVDETANQVPNEQEPETASAQLHAEHEKHNTDIPDVDAEHEPLITDSQQQHENKSIN